MSLRGALFVLLLASCHHAHASDFSVPFRPMKDTRPIESRWLPVALTDRVIVRIQGKKHLHFTWRFGP